MVGVQERRRAAEELDRFRDNGTRCKVAQELSRDVTFDNKLGPILQARGTACLRFSGLLLFSSLMWLQQIRKKKAVSETGTVNEAGILGKDQHVAKGMMSWFDPQCALSVVRKKLETAA